MRVLEKRLRRLEIGLLPPPETAESRRVHEIVLDIRRTRAARLGLPEPEDLPAVDASGQVVDRFRMTPTGPQRLSLEEEQEEHSRPSRRYGEK
jgi:hypothetical protein